ncbi:hypothetical protein SAMN05660477_00102 [Soonwooa buanensis]|uniref:Uncharacterized protein n=2 Tax=Soonwooa buanensis TaxID=619805 RepID=A0A1T5CJI2_9FLAO|nr:hypothetical protein SAMN05660477_00102 [Soonwooa buanensis]
MNKFIQHNMKKKYFIGFCVLFSSFAISQSMKNNMLYNGKKEIAKVEAEGCGVFSSNCVYHISSLDDKPLMSIALLESVNPLKKDADGKPSIELYLRFVFSDLDKAAEMDATWLNLKKSIAQTIVKNNFIVNQQINEGAVNNFIKLYGERYSEREKSHKEIILVK